MYTLSINMWFQKLMRQFFMGIDGVIYNFISYIYDLLISIARTSVLSQADILEMADKVYKLLAVFMIFKVTLSLITYVVNPDDFSDKTKGISKLGTNIVISLGLLIITPYIFNYAYRFQTFILEDNTLAHLIFETEESETENSANFFNTAGDNIAFMTMLPFFTPNISLAHGCVNIFVEEAGETKLNPECFGLDEKYNPLTFEGSKNFVTLLELKNDNFSEMTLINYAAGLDYRNLGLMFRQELGVATSEDDEFIIDYRYIFSTVVGVIVVLLLITFCLDVGVRSIKLAFLQLIAPIPILSYVDPKSGKDGMFKKWYQLCFKTYLSLFIRLLGLYFAVYIISKVNNMVDIIEGTLLGSTLTDYLIRIFIIIGALMFAKDLPKILEGLGIKLDGGGKFTLNPLRKIENEAMGGKYLKKPNDMLGKMGKAILKSPLTAASTTGKKIVAGTYSAANGRGFRRGWSSVDSPWKKNLNKKIDEWAPDFAKDRQEARVARLDAQESARKEQKVAKYFDKNGGGKAKFLDDLGSTDSKYRELYEEAENKKVAMYKAQAASNRWISAINNDKLSDEQRLILSKHFGAKEGELMSDDDLIRNLQKASGTAEKVYQKAEEAKTNYGKTSASARRAAELDKSYDSYDKLHIASGEIPKYTEAELDSVDSLRSEEESTSSADSVPESTVYETPATTDTNVMDGVNDITGVSRESASDNGATTGAIVESVMEEIRKEIEQQKRIHDTTTDGNEMVRASMRIKELEKELEDIRRKNS